MRRSLVCMNRPYIQKLRHFVATSRHPHRIVFFFFIYQPRAVTQGASSKIVAGHYCLMILKTVSFILRAEISIVGLRNLHDLKICIKFAKSSKKNCRRFSQFLFKEQDIF